MKENLGVEDLKEQLDDIHRRFPAFKEDDLFMCWFLRAYLTEDEKLAAEAVTGGSGDKSVDAVLVDHKAKAVFLVQGKYRKKVSGKTESRGDVMGFANLAKPFADAEPGPFKSLCKNMHEHVAKLLSEARPFVCEKSYRLWMYYVTLGSVSAALAEEAQESVANAAYDAVVEVLTGIGSCIFCAITLMVWRHRFQLSTWTWNSTRV